MRTCIYIIVVWAFIALPYRSAQAISIKDIATKIEDVLEGAIEWMKKANEDISAAEAKARDSKLGKMGKKAHDGYTKVSKFLIKDRKLGGLQVPSYLTGVATSVDGVYNQVRTKYMPTFTGKDDSVTQNRQRRHNMEVQHNLVADVYAKAFVLRNNLVDERKKGDIETKPTNSRELIETGRAYNEKIVQRYVDILAIEAALLDMENTEVLMSADPDRLQLAKEAGGVE